MKKKIILITALSGLIVLNTVSFSLAWYASSNQLRIEAVVINVDTDRELLISTSQDIDSFKDVVTTEELNQVAVFGPVSSMYSENWISNKDSVPTYYDCSYTQVDPTDPYGAPFLKEAKGGYFYQDLYLLSDDDVYVTLSSDEEDTYIKPNTSFNIAYAHTLVGKKGFENYTEEEIITHLEDLVKAMRFSILIDDPEEYQFMVLDPNKNEEEVEFGGPLDNSITRTYDWYMRNGNRYETIYGEVNDRSLAVYDDALDEDYPVVGEPSAFNAGHAAGVKIFNKEASVANGLRFAKENSYTLEDFARGIEPKFYFPLKAHTPKKVGVSIYIEGWDLDSINHTMGAHFISNLSFTIYREM